MLIATTLLAVLSSGNGHSDRHVPGRDSVPKRQRNVELPVNGGACRPLGLRKMLCLCFVSGQADIPKMVASNPLLDHSVAPVSHMEGGSRAGYLRWDRFRCVPASPAPDVQC